MDEGDDEIDIWQAVHSHPDYQPLKVFLEADGAAARQQSDATVVTGTKDMRVFYGNLSCYTFFRLYQKLYERLEIAKKLSEDMQQREDDAAEVGDAPELPGGGKRSEISGLNSADGDDEEAKNMTVYDKFMTMLVQLVVGNIDTSKFEDDCRMLLGTNSYELYTLEKVVEKLLSQAQSLTSEASAQSGSRLLALHEYELLRAAKQEQPSNDVDSEGLSACDYLGNASCLTGDDGCFGFYYDMSQGVLSIGVLDNKDTSSLAKTDARVERRREEWFEDLLAPGTIIEAREKLSYTHRSLPRAMGGKSELELLTGLAERKDLEIAYGEDRVSFQPLTSDFHHRPANVRATGAVSSWAKNRRAAKVRSWQKERLLAIPAEAAAQAALKAEKEAEERAAAEADEDEEDEDEEGEAEGDGEDEDGEEGDGDEDDGEDGGEGDEDENAEGEDEDGDEGEGDEGEGGGLDQLMQAGRRGTSDGEAAEEEALGEDGDAAAMEMDPPAGEALVKDEEKEEGSKSRAKSRGGSRGRGGEASKEPPAPARESRRGKGGKASQDSQAAKEETKEDLDATGKDAAAEEDAKAEEAESRAEADVSESQSKSSKSKKRASSEGAAKKEVSSEGDASAAPAKEAADVPEEVEGTDAKAEEARENAGGRTGRRSGRAAPPKRR